MVFANRRTGIWEDWALIGILQDDGYRLLGLDEDPVAGDVVFYYREQRVVHAGLVVSAEPVQILSKMGITGGEELHEAKLFDGGRSRMEFWTERGNGRLTNSFFNGPLIKSP